MNFFAYGSIVLNYKNNPLFIRDMVVIAEQAWVKGVLYDTGLGFPALTLGEERVQGKLFEVNHGLIETLKGIAAQYDELNPPYQYVLKPIEVYSDQAECMHHAWAFVYEQIHGLSKIERGVWI
jgi:gamma-glutamylcyclotransferase (GGCT)/AIG2-like uncharacterized protein YtfP